MSTRPEILISIVHHNTPEILERCLNALEKEGSSLRMHIVVVDNASQFPPDAAALSRRPNVTYLRNEINVGFGRANNQAFKVCDADAYLVTNPDVVVAAGSLDILMRRLLENPAAGLIGARLRYPDGRLQSSCRRLPTLRSVLLRGFLAEKQSSRFELIRRYLMTGETFAAPTRVDWLLGSCLLIKREALRQVGGFDEDFFMYYEDIDLCYRIAQAGWAVEYHPDVEWVHDYRRQSALPGQWKLRLAHFRSALLFLIKHLTKRGWRAIF